MFPPLLFKCAERDVWFGRLQISFRNILQEQVGCFHKISKAHLVSTTSRLFLCVQAKCLTANLTASETGRGSVRKSDWCTWMYLRKPGQQHHPNPGILWYSEAYDFFGACFFLHFVPLEKHQYVSGDCRSSQSLHSCPR